MLATHSQFSELHDASSKRWTQLRSFTALVFLLLTQNCEGGVQVVGPSQPVKATVGDDVLLSCRLEPAVDASDMSMEWSRDDLDPPFVFVWWDGEELESSKHPSYKGRTSLLVSKLELGEVSLKLSKVKLSDNGKYSCFIPTLGERSTVELVVGAVSFPVISLEGLDRSSSSVVLQCESAGWYPEPEVLWLDAEGNLLSAGPPETVRGPDDLYTVSSRVTVEKRHSNNFTCRVQQNNINQSRETRIHVSDDVFEVLSSCTSTTICLAVSLVVSAIMVIPAVVLFVHTRRQNRRMKTLEKKKHQESKQMVNEYVDINHQLRQEKQERKKAENKVETFEKELEQLQENNSETNNQLQQEKLNNETLNSRLRELLREKLKWAVTKGKLKTGIQNMNKELEKKVQDEKQEWTETDENLKTELQNMNKELELEGPITVEEVNEEDSYIRLKNISTEEIKLEGWKIELQIKYSEPLIYPFDESVRLQAGGILCIRRPGCPSERPDDVDLEWWCLIYLSFEYLLGINLINSNGEIYRVL